MAENADEEEEEEEKDEKLLLLALGGVRRPLLRRCSPLSKPPSDAADSESGTALRYLHWPGRVAVSAEQAWFSANL